MEFLAQALVSTPGVIILLFCIGLALITAELFVPGGLIGILGAIMIVGSIYLCFSNGMAWMGATLIMLSLIGIPIIILKGLKRMSLKEAQTAATGFSPSHEDRQQLIGSVGVATSALRPAGTARIDNRRQSVVTRGEMIDVNTKIEVIEIEGNRVVVRACKV